MSSIESRKNIHLVGHAHVDDVWLWPRVEAHQAVIGTFRTADKLMDRYPNFNMVLSSMSFVAALEKADPQLFTRVGERIRQERIELVGGKWVEPDCNTPSGESQLRQFLLGKRYAKEKFGVDIKVGFEPDAFGHAATTPKLLQHAGIDSYFIQRPEKNEMGGLSEPSLWVADDGSSVLLHRVPDYGAGPNGFKEHLERVVLHHAGDGKHALMLYGIGDHGGGPTAELLDAIAREQQTSEHIIIHSTLGKFADAVRNQKGHTLPPFRDELQRHAPGCYSAGAEIKQKNRVAENAVLAAEKLRSLTRAITGLAYPSGELLEQQKIIARSQFHDTKGGTLPLEYYEGVKREIGGAIEKTNELKNEALLSLAAKIEIPHEEHMEPLLVVNPHTWQTNSPIEIEVQSLQKGAKLFDNHGNEIPYQEIKSITETGGRHRIVFEALNLPSLGYRLYKLINKKSEIETQTEVMLADNNTIENDAFKLTIDQKTGAIAGLYNKEKNMEVFRGIAGIPVVIDEHLEDGRPVDTWGHHMYSYRNKLGQFETTHDPKLVEHGKVKSVIRTKSGYYGDPDNDKPTSTMRQDFTMYKNTNLIRVDVTVDWHEQHKMLKLRFPVELEKRTHTYEIPYGTLERGELGLEVPGQSWVDMSGEHGKVHQHAGIAFINDGKYGHDIMGREYNMTVLRSPAYAHHDPQPLDPEQDHDYMDQGLHRFTYWMLPHDKTWKQANIPQIAAECNQPASILLVNENPDPDGALPQEDSFARVEADNVMMTVVKHAEDPNEEALVVRLYQTDHRATETFVVVNGRRIHVKIGASKLKSLKIPFDKNAPIFETDATELTNIAFQ